MAWRREQWLPYVGAVAIFFLTALAAFYAASAATTRERLDFDGAVGQAEDEIKQRLIAYIAMLRAGAGLFAATGGVSREQFSAYVERLDLPRVYPGIQGIGVSLRAAPAQRAALVARMRAQDFSDFRIWPEDERAEYHAIVYLEPLDRRNRAALGYDMFTEAVRRAAMERARDTAEPAASGRVTLVQEIDERKQAGFLIYVPMYEGGAVPATVEERRATLVGFIYSPFRAADLLEAVLPPEIDAALTVAVHDGDDPHADALLYRSAGGAAGARPFVATRKLIVAGRPWTLVFAGRPAAGILSGPVVAGGIVAFGLLLSTLLFGMLRAELRTRETAEQALMRERHARDQAEQMAAVSRALNSTLDFARLGQMIVDSVRAFAGVRAAVLYRLDGASGELRLVASSGDVGPALVRGTVIPAGSGAVGRAVREARTVVTPNFADDSSITLPPAVAATLGSVPYRAVLALPLIVHERVIGGLGLGDETGRVFGDDEIALAEAFASHAATALENARLLQDAEAARAEAEAANRTKDEFLATVSHELRTPLNAILGWARMLRTGALGPHTPAHALDVVERNAMTQAQLIDDLLDVSRITTGKLELDLGLVDLPRVIEAAVDAVRPGAQARRVHLSTAVPAHVGYVAGDADRLQQVVWNLLTNAIKFTPPGGDVHVRLERDGNEAVIVVRDTGEGIPPAVLPHVFERFRQADSSSTRAHRGLGLGLALVKHLVELHGGTVTAESAGPGLGSTFVVRLPLSVSDAGSALDRPARADRARLGAVPALRNVRILAVDDDRDSLDVLATTLIQAGAEIRTAASAAEALGILDEWQPEVLLSDIEMPGENGYALIQRIRERETGRGPRLPAIAVTAYGRMEDRIRALASGFDEHVTKPFDPEALATAIVTVIDQTNTGP